MDSIIVFIILLYQCIFCQCIFVFQKEKSIYLHHVRFSKINNVTINNKQGQHQKKNDGNIKKSMKKRRMFFSAKYAQNDREPVEESYKDVNEKNRNRYESNEDNYKIEEQKSTSSQEDELRMEKRKTEANINNNRIDYDRIESRNSIDEDNDKRSEKESVDHNMSDKTI